MRRKSIELLMPSYQRANAKVGNFFNVLKTRTVIIAQSMGTQKNNREEAKGRKGKRNGAQSRERNDSRKTQRKIEKGKQCKTAILDPSWARVNLGVEQLT